MATVTTDVMDEPACPQCKRTGPEFRRSFPARPCLNAFHNADLGRKVQP